VLGVVLPGQLHADGLELQRGEGQSLALDAAEHLTDQVPLHAVGLDQHESPLSHGAQPTGR
jgi:hypothetical protein